MLLFIIKSLNEQLLPDLKKETLEPTNLLAILCMAHKPDLIDIKTLETRLKKLMQNQRRQKHISNLFFMLIELRK